MGTGASTIPLSLLASVDAQPRLKEPGSPACSRGGKLATLAAHSSFCLRVRPCLVVSALKPLDAVVRPGSQLRRPQQLAMPWRPQQMSSSLRERERESSAS